MLPATGLFRTINCPFYEKDLCTRPYCHFKHAKAVPPVVKYSATPKSLLNQAGVSNQSDGSEPIARKKPKLEYIPVSTVAPKYVPSSVAKLQVNKSNGEKSAESESSDTNNQTPDVSEKDQPLQEDTSKEVSPEEKGSLQSESPAEKNDEKNEKKQENGLAVSSVEKKSSEDTKHHSSSKHHHSSGESDRKKDSNHRHSSSSRSKSSSTSSSSHDKKHRSSESSSKEKSSSNTTTTSSNSSSSSKSKHRDKERESSRSHSSKPSSDRDRDRHRSSSEKDHRSHSKSSSSKNSNTGGSTSSSKSKSHSSTSNGNTSTTSSSSRKKEHKSSSRSSGSSSRSKSTSSKADTSEKLAAPEPKSTQPLEDEIYQELINNPPSDIDIDSDEDDVMQQCKMIFEGYEPDVPPKAEESETKANGQIDLIDIFADKYYDDSRKKRVAYENATTSKLTPVVEKKTNHVQNAIKSVYLRQEIVRKQQEELAARKRAEEEVKRQIEEETRKSMPKPATIPAPTVNGSSVSPLSTNTFYSKSPEATSLSTPKSRFTPAVNVLAFQKAKEKIEQLKRNQSAFTPAQTASKVGARVAHTGSVLATKAAATPDAQAPPILEPASSKISYNIRMQYYGLMVKHCLNIYPTCEDAWERAQTEELAVMKKCSTAMIYKSSALLTINKLRKEALETGNEAADKNKTVSHDVILAGKMVHNISWSVNKKLKTEVKTSAYTIDNAPGTVAYKMIHECRLTEDQLRSNGFPRATDVPGKAKIYTPRPSRPPNEIERYCSRCSKVFNLDTYDEPQVDACNYHPKSTCYRRGFADNLHNCCQQPSGTPGCMYANYHVSSFMDYDDLSGFVKTIEPAEDYQPSKKDVFALDCEMCYTTGGLELTRVTVVDINEKTVYDTLVKPLNRVVDYNTRFSGITEDMLRKTTTTLHNVQAVLLSMFNSETILIGHSLESDFKALKLIHDVVVDTSVLYPHKMGPPKKRALKTLCIENLKKIIQENDAGHDSAEDSVVCIQLIKHYLRNRIL
ncbi:RNA exonuclease 1 homolog [Anopheles maculipalpis]|uniref:RNA exonuclease 1 homolog n=1 Tax=Anopheles maculipalpis TaxID=1496333 RepID=UPI00215954A0|nr:RNA exonuclease 1 homolog [Anopheles maculipalpis]